MTKVDQAAADAEARAAEEAEKAAARDAYADAHWKPGDKAHALVAALDEFDERGS